VLLLMVDAAACIRYADELLLEKAKRFRRKTILALNKSIVWRSRNSSADRIVFKRLLNSAPLCRFRFAGSLCEELLDEICGSCRRRTLLSGRSGDGPAGTISGRRIIVKKPFS